MKMFGGFTSRWILALVATAACTPSTGAPPPNPDADIAIDPACTAHCAHAATLGCAEGASPACSSVCTVSEGSVVGRAVDWACVDRASSAVAARACGVRFCGGSQ